VFGDAVTVLYRTPGTRGDIDMVIPLLATVVGFAQTSLLVIITVTTSLSEIVVEVKAADTCPAAFTPFICHWYEGDVPPLVGVAVKVILLPGQIEVDDALIDTAGVTELVVIEIALLVAVDDVAQLALEVMITVTWSLFASELDENVGEFVPAFTPLICHW
jgi:hypothetical protein